ncbi:MAG: ATPase [Tistrella sp.]|uniref:ATPase n=1 Tax=Tistrella mobilis TaxID=171437 RepID=A0A3B9ISI0_9PROT|nr:ATP-binding protein [Tistrella sp.]MAD39036.1 ATPase [Tistrella sp.]MBA74733.1 ATPase [Tistrella sp.]HAE50273.1 ATPase [Tistrella mobilis]
MLTAITLENFKSYRSARLPLAPLTVLIGANASGKSNAVEAMRLLSWLAQGQKLSAIRYAIHDGEQVVRGKVQDLAYCEGDSFSIGCETDDDDFNRLSMTVSLREDGLHLAGEQVAGLRLPLYDLDQPSTGRSTDVRVAYDNFSRGGKKPHVVCSDQMAIFTQLTSPATFDAKHRKSRETIPKITRAYEASLGSMLFLDPVPARMRDYSFPGEHRLNGDGSNISSVLWDLTEGARSTGEATADVLGFVKSLPEQNIAGFDFLKEPRGGVMIQLEETFGAQTRRYDASLLSDGTLRVLAIAAAMLSAQTGSLVVIEEIDNGVHPSRARHLLDSIRSLARRRGLRVLLSTHNPALLDALPDEAVPDVVFCYRDPEDGSSRLVRLDDLPTYPELVAQGSLGDLATSGALERAAKIRIDEATRRSLALAWMDRLG